MTQTLVHRGPDDRGTWFDEEAGLAFGHRRLSILDLSAAGRQPMISSSGRYVLNYNGEIYNHKTLRAQLEVENVSFRSHCDTEVILEAVSLWGLEITLKRLNGMFAFALWDRELRILYLARDRFGEKPLYYGWCGQTFLFSSELKALREHPDFQSRIDPTALSLYFLYNYVPGPRSIYEGIQKLLPGTYLKVPTDRVKTKFEPQPYWLLSQVAQEGCEHPLKGSEGEITESFDSLFRDAVKMRMEADVPLGAFFSGGIDSTAVVALMQSQSQNPVKTFTVGFHEASYNEATYAEALAKHLGTDHTSLYVTPKETQAVIPLLSTIYDEPFADASQIPVILVSKLARTRVTVCLSGDGGDELFGGYKRYFVIARFWKILRNVPTFARKGLGNFFDFISQWPLSQRLLRIPSPRLPNRLKRLGEMLSPTSFKALYFAFMSSFQNLESLLRDGAPQPLPLSDLPQLNNVFESLMLMDSLTYLPDDILVKVDRAGMSQSLETRAPFLDHRLAEFAWRLPMSMKVRNNQGKWILRANLRRHVPATLIERPKMGFGIPLDQWLRGPIKEWAWNLINENRLRQEGFLKHELIQKKWNEHQRGMRDWSTHLWNILMVQSWLEGTRAQRSNNSPI